MGRSARKPAPVIGWREWVALPALNIGQVKAKIDTGARSSCLHAFDVIVSKKGAYQMAHFRVFPRQDDVSRSVRCAAELRDFRWIRSSNGRREYRPVIQTSLEMGGESWPIDLTLTSRDAMGFRMLLGREAIRGRFVVDPGRSFRLERRSRPAGRIQETPP